MSATAAPRGWQRLLVVEVLNAVPLAVALAGRGAAALWCAGLMGSALCCVGTDSGWRWRNRVLVLQAILWLLLPLLFAGGG
jgi:hypothetical protein